MGWAPSGFRTIRTPYIVGCSASGPPLNIANNTYVVYPPQWIYYYAWGTTAWARSPLLLLHIVNSRARYSWMIPVTSTCDLSNCILRYRMQSSTMQAMFDACHILYATGVPERQK